METNGRILDNQFLLALFLALQGLDVVSTMAVLSTGLASEGNPLFVVIASMVGEGSAWIAIITAKIIAVAFVLVLSTSIDEGKARKMLYAVNFWMLFVVIHNYWMYAGLV